MTLNDETKTLALVGGTAITPFRTEADCTLVLAGGKIVHMGHQDDVTPPADAERIDVTGHYVLPGFIDIHVHGGRGLDFADADATTETFDEISRFFAGCGTTSLIATVYPQPTEHLLACVRTLRRYCESAGPGRILEGIHLEGPFLNPEMHGAIRPDYIWPPSVEAFRLLIEAGGPWVRVMTIAPEMPGAMEVLRAASMAETAGATRGARPAHPLHMSIGHSKAVYEQIAEAIDNGLEGVTHIFNGMPPMHHRRPGVLAGTMLRDELFVEVIADAIHVHPAVLQLLMKVKGHDKIILVSDAIRAAGQPDGEYVFSGQKVDVRKGRAYLASAHDTLAGSTTTLDKALRTMIRHAGASLVQAAQMASLNAARVLEWKYRRGILAVGKDADLAILDKDLNVQITIKAGRIVYRA
ncbi:MAG: N-acetylglucosamine-6-phosphate deacetylase [Phycisphaerae bacterium]|nr:N-acetylglucosamine-6-phosphate deacetylase [Phycisphaerae bacterium]